MKIGGMVFILALIALFLTNTTNHEYKEFIAHTLTKKAEGNVGSIVLPILSPLINSEIIDHTKRTDFLLFTVYQTNLEGCPSEVLGIARNFIIIKTKKNG